MTGIAPGAYVRAVSGMYRGAEGCVVRIDVSASGSYAVVDVGEAQPIAVYVSALELVGAVPTVEQERDAAIAERDRLRAERDEAAAAYRELHAAARLIEEERDRLRAQLELVTAENHARAMREAQSLDDWSALRAERDRLRRELESLRKGGEVIIRLRERVRALEGALADVYAAAGVDLDNAPIVNGDWRGAVQMLTNGALTSFVEEIVCATIAERDRLRREVEALREWADSVAEEQWPDTTAESLVERLDAILRGEP